MKWLRVSAIAWLLLSSLVAAPVCAWDEPTGPDPYFGPEGQSKPAGTEEFDPMGESPFPPGRNVMEPPDGEGFKWPSLPKPKMPPLPKFSLPRLKLPSWSTEKQTTQRPLVRKTEERKTEEPSTWTKFSSGTKDLFTKTKRTLMPWSEEGESAPRSSSTVRRPAPRSRTKAKPTSSEKKKSLFPWFTKEETEEPISTVNDFLSQPRVQ